MIESFSILFPVFLTKLVLAIVAYFTLRMCLNATYKYFDFDIKEWFDKLEVEKPEALALYLGLTVIGYALLFAFILS